MTFTEWEFGYFQKQTNHYNCVTFLLLYSHPCVDREDGQTSKAEKSPFRRCWEVYHATSGFLSVALGIGQVSSVWVHWGKGYIVCVQRRGWRWPVYVRMAIAKLMLCVRGKTALKPSSFYFYMPGHTGGVSGGATICSVGHLVCLRPGLGGNLCRPWSGLHHLQDTSGSEERGFLNHSRIHSSLIHNSN